MSTESDEVCNFYDAAEYLPPGGVQDQGTSKPLSQANKDKGSFGELQAARRRSRWSDLANLLSRNKVVYPSLTAEQDFRILWIDPGQDDEPLRCKLVPAHLPSGRDIGSIDYKALSYWWGEDTDDHQEFIEVIFPIKSVHNLYNSLAGESKFKIGSNLLAALQRIRQPDKGVWCWTDAICINQEDEEERSYQVSRMDEIYSAATEVVIWLGKGESHKEEEETFKHLDNMLNLKDLDLMIDGENANEYVKKWMLIVKLMRKEWFSRRWVIQELALARKATVYFGSAKLDWQPFAQAVALFIKKFDKIRPRLTDALLKEMFIKSHPDVHLLGANVLVELTTNLFRKSQDGRILQKRLTLEALVSTLLPYEAKDPRDIIFALLPIAKDTYRPNNATMKDSDIRRSNHMGDIFEAQTYPRRRDLEQEEAVKGFDATSGVGHVRSGSLQISTVAEVLAGEEPLMFEGTQAGPLSVEASVDVDNVRARESRSGYGTKYVDLRVSMKTKYSDKRIWPLYEKTILDVYTDFISYCISSSHSLDVLCRNWVPSPKQQSRRERYEDLKNDVSGEHREKLPSWLSSIEKSSHGNPKQAKDGRRNADSLVGIPNNQNRSYYFASADLLPQVNFGQREGEASQIAGAGPQKSKDLVPGSPADAGVATTASSSTSKKNQEQTDSTRSKKHVNAGTGSNATAKVSSSKYNGILSVKGIKVGTIEICTLKASSATIHETAFEMFGWNRDEKKLKYFEEFWRTIVADRGPEGIPVPAWYTQACLESLTYYDSHVGMFSVSDLGAWQACPSIMAEFLERVKRVIWGRRFIEMGYENASTSHMYFGLAPGEAEKGDIVCVLFGCSVPVVLRDSGNGYHEFIGECYIHGIMDGEIVPKRGGAGANPEVPSSTYFHLQ
ncbi:hypothetical protein GJ744_006636 [Endocarpon pusillum]|uniref:Heterokaryon incompatibility domain-containing protein n=1 Tax=Endocarpon pusillum TaxID=364733 RepID=A0A8H7ATF1_9EURO|nr:hypothetical protein GJ744_006636 [Endocarpon pusillum]